MEVINILGNLLEIACILPTAIYWWFQENSLMMILLVIKVWNALENESMFSKNLSLKNHKKYYQNFSKWLIKYVHSIFKYAMERFMMMISDFNAETYEMVLLV